MTDADRVKFYAAMSDYYRDEAERMWKCILDVSKILHVDGRDAMTDREWAIADRLLGHFRKEA